MEMECLALCHNRQKQGFRPYSTLPRIILLWSYHGQMIRCGQSLRLVRTRTENLIITAGIDRHIEPGFNLFFRCSGNHPHDT